MKMVQKNFYLGKTVNAQLRMVTKFLRYSEGEFIRQVIENGIHSFFKGRMKDDVDPLYVTFLTKQAKGKCPQCRKKLNGKMSKLNPGRSNFVKYSKNYVIHHKDRNRKNNKLNNLELLCRVCHIKLHQKLKKQTA